MTPKEFEKHIAKMAVDIKKAINKDIPRKLSKSAVRAFKDNFKDEGFFGEKWDEVQRRKTKTVQYKTKTGKLKTKMVKVEKGTAGKRKILTGTGDLGRSIKSKVVDTQITIYSDLKYSSAHNNEGTDIAGRGHKTKIPKRQFIGEHAELRRILLEKIEQTLNDIIK